MSKAKSRRPSGFLLARLADRLIVSPARTEEERRRGITLSVLLLAVMGLSFVAMTVSTLGMLLRGQSFTGASPAISAVFLLVFTGLYIWARFRVASCIALIFISIFIIIATYSLYFWGVILPEGLLLYSLAIAMSGVLLGTRLAVGVTLAVIGLIILLTWSQSHGFSHPDMRWIERPLSSLDSIGFGVTLGVLALATWLSTRQAERSLARARQSELELTHERDNLERKVAERAYELEQEQIARQMELHRFTELGRVSAGFLHDMASPLTAAILSLDQLGKEEHSDLLKRARLSIHYVERYVDAARKRLQERSDPREFMVASEINLVLGLLAHKARAHHVRIQSHVDESARLYGDPVRFNQLVANLLTNAIEAYDKPPTGESPWRAVDLTIWQNKGSTIIRVHDWGKGFKKAARDNIFAPFYSTKSGVSPGMGLGLTIVKRIAEQEFGGSATATSHPARGTEFEICLGDWRG